MWNNKIPEIISERPEEEDKESYRQDDVSPQGQRKSNKINKILDTHKTQTSDYNNLFKEKKTNSMRNKPSPINPLEERPSLIQSIEEDTVGFINTA